ncbi:MAG TPA: phosphotransferase [Actinomycetota bacterium]|nr:phosphotransferase [Actinomycetota bacterium]
MGARRVALKRYSDEDTARFMCIGSGARNEALLPSPAARLAPALLDYRRDEAGETVVLEWVDGERVPAARYDTAMARRAADALALVHSVESEAFGSLDGAFRFASAAAAFAPRWDVAMTLLRGVDAGLASGVSDWGRERAGMPDASCRGARLVHGDFGPANLLWGARREPVVVDWEHARFGDEREDWAKILLAFRFREPNGFDLGVARAVTYRLRAGAAGDVRDGAMDLYLVYFAATLAAFFGDDDRLEWLSRVVSRSIRSPLAGDVARDALGVA